MTYVDATDTWTFACSGRTFYAPWGAVALGAHVGEAWDSAARDIRPRSQPVVYIGADHEIRIVPPLSPGQDETMTDEERIELAEEMIGRWSRFGERTSDSRLVALLRVIPHAQQRYDTCGDWQQTGDHVVVTASALGDQDFEFLVLLHELVEWALCRRRGITEAQVDAWDTAWHEHDGIEEAGDDPCAPYHREHELAGVVERLVAHALGVDWQAYESALDALPPWRTANPQDDQA